MNMLSEDPAEQARESTRTHQVILHGTRLRDILLQRSPILPETPTSSDESSGSREPATVLDTNSPDAQPAATTLELEAERQPPVEDVRRHTSPLMQDQRLQSWVRRYSLPNPIVLPGDPEINLNPTQIRAIALMLASRVSLVQGVRPRRCCSGNSA
jgi:regulator of nonsense transcripts 1